MKAQGLSINTIIISAIALVVLVVLIAVFTGRMSLFGQGLDQTQRGDLCEGGTLTVVEGNQCPEGATPIYRNFRDCTQDEDPESTGCMKPGYICCSQ
jgi:hypothetical protein